MENVFDFAAIERVTDVLLEEFEARIIAEMSDVLQSSGQQIVGANHGVAFAKQCIA
jgi:hypothetical protein